MPRPDTFYELVISNCDGGNATLHLWRSGLIELHSGRMAIARDPFLLQHTVRHELEYNGMPAWCVKLLANKWRKPMHGFVAGKVNPALVEAALPKAVARFERVQLELKAADDEVGQVYEELFRQCESIADFNNLVDRLPPRCKAARRALEQIIRMEEADAAVP